jgi:cystathionine gamma-synthase
MAATQVVVIYSRDQSPAYDGAEKLLAELEGGAQALLFASGMAAATAVLLALKPGDRLVAARSAYWAWRNWLRDFTSQWGIELAAVHQQRPENT